jgi:4-hydroxybenzoate polyprenyltransferase
MRVHAPLPIILNFLPILLIICSQYFLDIQNNGESKAHLWTVLWITIIGSFLTRSLGCVINDFLDKDFDKKTNRTKKRPLALDDSDKSKPTNFGVTILIFILTSSSLSLAIILGKTPIIISLCTGVLVIFYPLTKRFFFLPQLFLGIVYNMGIIIVCSAVDGWLNFQCLFLYLISILWTLAYDTVYAGQDKDDDKKNNLKSSVLTFGPKWRDVVNKIYNIIFGLLVIFGFSINGRLFFPFTVISFIFIKYKYHQMITKESFQKFFEYNVWIFILLLIGVILDILIFKLVINL